MTLRTVFERPCERPSNGLRTMLSTHPPYPPGAFEHPPFEDGGRTPEAGAARSEPSQGSKRNTPPTRRVFFPQETPARAGNFSRGRFAGDEGSPDSNTEATAGPLVSSAPVCRSERFEWLPGYRQRVRRTVSTAARL